jgi:hypothetical protein
MESTSGMAFINHAISANVLLGQVPALTRIIHEKKEIEM